MPGDPLLLRAELSGELLNGTELEVVGGEELPLALLPLPLLELPEVVVTGTSPS